MNDDIEQQRRLGVSDGSLRTVLLANNEAKNVNNPVWMSRAILGLLSIAVICMILVLILVTSKVQL